MLTHLAAFILCQEWVLRKSSLAKCLADNQVAIVDATNIKPEARKRLIAIAKQYTTSNGLLFQTRHSNTPTAKPDARRKSARKHGARICGAYE